MSAIDLSGYEVTDTFFGRPFIDVDEERDRPSPHRFIQGGFPGTDTEFAFYFPAAEHYTGRMFQPLEGGNGGHAVTFGGGILGEMFQRIAMSARLGGYMVESNQGHKGDDFDPRAGEDPTLYGHRASAESARLSKYVAAQVYGSAPHHSYVWGGSGGGRRSPLCLENGPGVWDGCMPSTSGGEIAPPGNTQRVKAGSIMSFGQMFNVQRLLGIQSQAGPSIVIHNVLLERFTSTLTRGPQACLRRAPTRAHCLRVTAAAPGGHARRRTWPAWIAAALGRSSRPRSVLRRRFRQRGPAGRRRPWWLLSRCLCGLTIRAIPYTFRLSLLPFAFAWRPLLSAPAALLLPPSKFGPSCCRPLAERVTILTIRD